MKKIVSFILAAVLCLSVFSFCVCADSIHKAQCGHIADKAGRTVAVPVNYSSDNGVYIVRIFMEYDTSALKFMKTENSASDKFGYTVNEKDGKITVIADARQIDNVSGNFELFKALFEIKDTAKTGQYNLTLSGEGSRLDSSDSGYSVETLDIAFTSGSVTVICEEHSFKEETQDGTKCENCEAVENDKKEVSVPVKKEENNEETFIKPGEAVVIPEKNEGTTPSEKEDGGSLTIVYIIIAIVVLVLGSAIFILFKIKDKKKEA